jgi:inhibitor of cysteine peptidase
MKRINFYFLSLLLLVFVAIPTSDAKASCLLPTGNLTFGNFNSAIQSLQVCLIADGYFIPAGSTGYYGEQTKQAVQKFYANKLGLNNWNGLSVGPLGRGELVKLNSSGISGYKKVGSEAEFKKYLAENSNVEKMSLVMPMMQPSVGLERDDSSVADKASTPSRVSETNVQVVGVDEPDIVKTDGENIFYSRSPWFSIEPMPMMRGGMTEKMIAPSPMNAGFTNIIKAFPSTELAEVEKMKENGDLLLDKSSNTLIILSYPSIVAYDVNNEAKPKKLWDMKINGNTSLVTARLNNGQVYLVTETWVDNNRPCPMIPVTVGARDISIPCADIYVPMKVEPVSHTYNVLSVDPATGEVENKLSLASESGATTIMMSKDNLYLASHNYSDNTEVMIEVLRLVSEKYLSASAKNNIAKIVGYDISLSGKLNEIQLVIQNDWANLSADERLKMEKNFGNDVSNELAKRQRDLETTRIVRVSLSTLAIEAVGAVPGTLLNQFSMDEYKGDLRVSTTIGENNWWFGWGNTGNSVNDVYVLGSDLKKKGEVLNLGKGERIYSTRFMGDQGYVVTFRQTDPFYVLDLADPVNPKLSGELKIPGYSSYLEKITDNLVLGVGREGNGVKLSLFDVTNPATPKEVSKYLIKDEWSEVENNHHAFMLDSDNKTFFIPGGQGGYFFTYKNDELKLQNTVAQSGVVRAIYIDDYYYIISGDAIKVVDLNTWKEVEKLDLKR